MKYNGYTLHYASEDLKKDRDIILMAMKNMGWALEYDSEDLKDVKNGNGCALAFA